MVANTTAKQYRSPHSIARRLTLQTHPHPFPFVRLYTCIHVYNLVGRITPLCSHDSPDFVKYRCSLHALAPQKLGTAEYNCEAISLGAQHRNTARSVNAPAFFHLCRIVYMYTRIQFCRAHQSAQAEYHCVAISLGTSRIYLRSNITRRRRISLGTAEYHCVAIPLAVSEYHCEAIPLAVGE